MSRHLMLIRDDEALWAAMGEAERESVFAKHREFNEALEARGHRIVTASALAPSTSSRVIAGSPVAVQVSDGPYAESAEQLSGFYVLETDDVDDLVACVAILAEAEGALELRALEEH